MKGYPLLSNGKLEKWTFGLLNYSSFGTETIPNGWMIHSASRLYSFICVSHDKTDDSAAASSHGMSHMTFLKTSKKKKSLRRCDSCCLARV